MRNEDHHVKMGAVPIVEKIKEYCLISFEHIYRKPIDAQLKK